MDPSTPTTQAPKPEKTATPTERAVQAPKKFTAPKLALPKTFLVWAGIGALVVGFILVVAFLATQPWKGVSPTPTPSVDATASPSPTPSPTASSISAVTDDGVTWLEKEEKISDQKLYKNLTSYYTSGENAITYYKLGSDNGQDIIATTIPPDGLGGNAFEMFVKTGTNSYEFIRNHSDEVTVAKSDNTSGPVEHADKVKTNTTKVYKSITVQNSLTLNNVKVTLRPAMFASGSYFGQFETLYKDYKLSEAGKTPYGTMYLARRQGTDGTDVVTYLLRRPNNTYAYYYHVPTFVKDDGVPTITWSDGTTNKDAYRYDGTGGCGSVTYISVLDSSTKITDLVATGKTSTQETIYAFKDKNNKALQSYYSLMGGKYYDQTKNDYSSITIEEFMAKHGAFVYKDPLGHLVFYTSLVYGLQVECGKPVVYLYPTKPTNVSVKVDAKITVSDPDYGKGWNVTAHPDGTLYLANGQKYDSLFWEGTGKEYPAITSGFIVSRVNVEATLKDHLAKLGMNTKESADFMEFWMPKMPNTPYVRLTWFGTREMDRLAPLTVTPKPDSVIRIFLDFEGLQEKISLPTQRLTSIARKGFTVTEWGGLLRK